MRPKSGRGFDDLAEAYDRYRFGYADDVYDALFSYGLVPGGRVLDVGCGTGLVAAALAARGCPVVGVDVSEAMLERARRRASSSTFEIGHAESLRFADSSFDGAVSAQAFHWFDRTRALTELERVVRSGGVVAIWWKGLNRGDGVRLLRERAAREAGLDPPSDLLGAGFPEFEHSHLEDRRLRVIPWSVQVTVAAFLGYERSRARSRDAFGDRLEDYLVVLARLLGPPESELSLSYLHHLYLGRVSRPKPAG